MHKLVVILRVRPTHRLQVRLLLFLFHTKVLFYYQHREIIQFLTSVMYGLSSSLMDFSSLRI